MGNGMSGGSGGVGSESVDANKQMIKAALSVSMLTLVSGMLRAAALTPAGDRNSRKQNAGPLPTNGSRCCISATVG
ncbi:hypothetical protein RRG08_033630 [Elysia crispata]|uniref:Uncharacterized protein n=1 Tax=Elysia crispata TaxID=231223 RepID=A0AAE0XRS0_9GAST|nr:hypothetical protein RRG08_033630 [Elysia crispata]